MPSHVTADDQVARATCAVPRGHYAGHPRLGTVPQATAQPAVERDLRRADVMPGQAVLEIGTGTGLTGALLAELPSPAGPPNCTPNAASATSRWSPATATREHPATARST